MVFYPLLKPVRTAFFHLFSCTRASRTCGHPRPTDTWLHVVPTSWGGLNVVLQDAPEGFVHVAIHLSQYRGDPLAFRDDYFLLLLDSGGSTMYSLSQRFTISKSGSAASGGLPPTVATATVSGAPNPTMKFAATYGASGASRTSVSTILGVGVGVVCSLWGMA